MNSTIAHISVSLDGFMAGPSQGPGHPYGVGGEQLQEWHQRADEPGHEADRPLREALFRPMGAYVMGRNMFGPIRGEWVGDWRGWWRDPPFHAPVFVLTHHPRDPVEMVGGTTFIFVTDGLDAALDRARSAAGGADIRISGGASTLHQALRAVAVDELQVSIVPVFLGRGERLFEHVEGSIFNPIEVTHSPYATHVRYQIARRHGAAPF